MGPRAVLVLVVGCCAVLLAPVGPVATAATGRSGLYADFNGDGYTDIAASVYDEDQLVADVGIVQVFYGGAGGIGAAGNQIFSQNTPGIPDQAEAGDEFGRNLGSGDYNCDGYADLAAGAAGEDLQTVNGSVTGAGAATIIYGGPDGLAPGNGPGAQFWTEDDLPRSDGAEDGDEFGWNFDIGTGNGDFNGDGCDDLAVAANTDSVGAIEQAGAVVVLYGGTQGLSVSNGPGDQWWTQDSPGILDQAEPNDIFGRGLASNDFDRDGFDDLAIGTNLEDVGDAVDAGSLNVIYGSPDGLAADAGPGNQFITQDDFPCSGGSEDGDWMGRTGLMTGDLNGDGYADFLGGIMRETVNGLIDAGAAFSLYGGPDGLDVLAGPGAQCWTQNSPGVPDQSEEHDLMGRYVEVGDYNGDGYDDAAIGVEWETLEELVIQHTGGVEVIYGSPDGLDVRSGPGARFWTQNDLPCTDGANVNDHSARMLATGDYNGDGIADLGYGIPGESVGDVGAAGAFAIVSGSPNGLTAEGCQWWNQDSPGAQDQAEEEDLMARWLTSG